MILLDINLPHRNGLEVLQALRAADNLVPVIVLSARDGEFDKVAALRLGADDYLTKPFALAELLARMEAVLRRAQAVPTRSQPEAVEAPEPPTGDQLRFGDVVDRRPLAHRDPRRPPGEADPPGVRAAAVLRAQPLARVPARRPVPPGVGADRGLAPHGRQLRRAAAPQPGRAIPSTRCTSSPCAGSGYRFEP